MQAAGVLKATASCHALLMVAKLSMPCGSQNICASDSAYEQSRSSKS